MPTGLTVIPGDGSATLSWDENTAYKLHDLQRPGI